jgi:hypothetical protein
MKETEVVKWLVEFWPVVTRPGLRPNHCILASRVAVEVGRYFGIPITERSTRCLVANARAWELLNQQIPVSEWPDDAWSVGVDPDDDRNRGTGYPGHVIAESEHYLIDLSAAQFSRPKRGLEFGPMFLPRPEMDTEYWTYADSENGTVIVYSPQADRRYRNAPDWREETNWKPEAAALIRLIRNRMQKGESDG